MKYLAGRFRGYMKGKVAVQSDLMRKITHIDDEYKDQLSVVIDAHK